MSSTGFHSLTIENLGEKTSKAYFAVRNILKSSFDTNVTLKIFDSVLQPILHTIMKSGRNLTRDSPRP